VKRCIVQRKIGGLDMHDSDTHLHNLVAQFVRPTRVATEACVGTLPALLSKGGGSPVRTAISKTSPDGDDSR